MILAQCLLDLLWFMNLCAVLTLDIKILQFNLVGGVHTSNLLLFLCTYKSTIEINEHHSGDEIGLIHPICSAVSGIAALYTIRSSYKVQTV